MTDLQALRDAHQGTRLLRLSFPKNDGPYAKLMVNRFDGTEYLSREAGNSQVAACGLLACSCPRIAHAPKAVIS